MESSQIFGLSHPFEESKIVLLPVPWEVTTSYGAGTSKGPEAILKASSQIDFFDGEFGEAEGVGIHMSTIFPELIEKNEEALKRKDDIDFINQECEELTAWVYDQTLSALEAGKLVGIIGGDHSVSLGAIDATCEKYEGNLGVLHFDAHMDLREAYQGYTYSHASVFNNVMNSDVAPEKLVQIGIRDFCREEYDFSQEDSRIHTYLDRDSKMKMAQGKTWAELVEEYISDLPDNVYVSFDIDGLDPTLCPDTGTPVPGGLSFDDAVTVLSLLAKSGRKIVGFDLVEVAPGTPYNEWNGNVGMRMLYKLCGWSAKSQGWI